MRTFKQHMDSVKHAMPTAQAASKVLEIINATNASANAIAGMFPVARLCDKITLSPGDRLPDNLAGIITVRDTSDNSRMFERGAAAVGDDEEVGRYYLEMEQAAYSASGFPFRSTGSISAGGKVLTCPDMISLSTGAYLYKRKIGDAVYQASIDSDGNLEYDADGKLVIIPIPTDDFDPQLSGVRFYDSGETSNDEIVYYDENEALAYWSHPDYGYIVSLIADVGGDPDGYFDVDDDEGVGAGDWANLYISMSTIEEVSAETVTDSDFTDLVVCITNSTYGDYYYKIASVNNDFTFKLSGTHPFAETNSVVRIYSENATLIKFVDYSEQEITSGTYTVYYWKFPNPMTQDSDIIPFAYPDYLELMTIRRLPETKDRRPVSKTELDDAKLIAKKKEPIQKPPSKPLTAQGSPFSMGGHTTDAYTVRGK